jgi:hypothetical protein
MERGMVVLYRIQHPDLFGLQSISVQIGCMDVVWKEVYDFFA